MKLSTRPIYLRIGNIMKTCSKCKQSKPLSEYHLSKTCSYSWCKKCDNKRTSAYRKTKQGVVSTIYGDQKSNSLIRGHKPPTYTKDELNSWLLNDWLFDLLYTNWCNCGYLKDMKPSVDRLDDSKGYSFDNIQIMTWKENQLKCNYQVRNNIKKHSGLLNGGHKAVSQYTLDGIFIKDFISASEASRQTNSNRRSLSACCGGNAKSCNGFVWKFK